MWLQLLLRKHLNLRSVYTDTRWLNNLTSYSYIYPQLIHNNIVIFCLYTEPTTLVIAAKEEKDEAVYDFHTRCTDRSHERRRRVNR